MGGTEVPTGATIMESVSAIQEVEERGSSSPFSATSGATQ